MTEPDAPSSDAFAEAVGLPGGSVPAPSRRRSRRAARPTTGPMAWLRETSIILVSALVLSWIVKTFLVQAFWIPSESMEDTLIRHDRILVSKLTPEVFDLHRGDVIVFRDPGGWLQGVETPTRTGVSGAVTKVLQTVGLMPADSDHLVKRLIGMPGDHVACAGPGSPITVNGVAIDESSYLKPGSEPSEMAFDVTVPQGYVWVMGDNRQHSADSRYNQGKPGGGAVAISNVVGVAFVTVWPLDRVSVHRNPGAVFANVPAPSS